MAKVKRQSNVLRRLWSTWNFHTLLAVMQNIKTSLENSLAVSYKVMHSPNIILSNSIPKHLLKNTKAIGPHRHLQVNVHRECSFFIRAKTLKQPKYPSAGEWMDRLTIIGWYMSIPPSATL
jgi:hypothetical protein